MDDVQEGYRQRKPWVLIDYCSSRKKKKNLESFWSFGNIFSSVTTNPEKLGLAQELTACLPAIYLMFTHKKAIRWYPSYIRGQKKNLLNLDRKTYPSIHFLKHSRWALISFCRENISLQDRVY